MTPGRAGSARRRPGAKANRTSTRSGRSRRGRSAPPTSGYAVLALPLAGIALVAVLAVEWLVCNVFAARYLDVRPGWDELAAIVPIMLIFAAIETLLALTASRRGYGALWLLFAIPGVLALIASAVWLAGGQGDGLGAPMWGLTGVLGGFNLLLLLLAVRSFRRASGVRPATTRRR